MRLGICVQQKNVRSLNRTVQAFAYLLVSLFVKENGQGRTYALNAKVFVCVQNKIMIFAISPFRFYQDGVAHIREKSTQYGMGYAKLFVLPCVYRHAYFVVLAYAARQV